jgi:hypothetical protein
MHLSVSCMAVDRLYQWAHGGRHVHAACGGGYVSTSRDRHAGESKGERSLDGRSAAAVKELGMTLGGEPEKDRR